VSAAEDETWQVVWFSTADTGRRVAEIARHKRTPLFRVRWFPVDSTKYVHVVVTPEEARTMADALRIVADSYG
jgi:hypothetical protein